MGVMYLAATLRKAGHEVHIHDSAVKPGRRALLDAIRSFSPNMVGLSALTVEAGALERATSAIAASFPGLPIIVGGPHATSYPEWVARLPGVVAAVLGEGESTVVELVHAVSCRSDLSAVNGICYRQADATLTTPARALIADVDSIPWPAWDLVDVAAYSRLSHMAEVGGERYATILTSRGCAYDCAYCHNIMGRRFRARSPASVMAELEHLVRELSVRNILVLDDAFNLDRRRAGEILEWVAESGWRLELAFPNGVRADLLDDDLVSRFHRAGTVHLAIAVETASPRLQTSIGRRLDLDRVQRVISAAARRRIYTTGFFMLGFPGETAEEMRSTVDYAVRSELHQALFFLVTLYGGTRLYQMAREATPALVAREPSFESMNYFQASRGMSAVSNRELLRMQRNAFRRFYLDPARVARIVRDHPNRRRLPLQGLRVLHRLLPRFERDD